MSTLRSGIKQVKVERPRPLKIGGGTQPELSLEDLISVLNKVIRNLSSSSPPSGETLDESVGLLKVLTANLKLSGPQLELSNKVRL